jgi:hypothetical protein
MSRSRPGGFPNSRRYSRLTVIAFLLSDEARWITAQDIEASGGFNL